MLAGSDYDLRRCFDFKRIRIVRDYADDLPEINCTETEIEQAVLNLLRNAAQALGTMGVEEPVITIHTRANGGSAVIEVEDNGPGIVPEISRRIFEPFFTTKPPGAGHRTRPVCFLLQSVTQGHGGTLTVQSAPGTGACFRIELPAQSPFFDVHTLNASLLPIVLVLQSLVKNGKSLRSTSQVLCQPFTLREESWLGNLVSSFSHCFCSNARGPAGARRAACLEAQ